MSSRRVPGNESIWRRVMRGGERALYACKRHYVSLASTAVIAVLLALTLTSTGFESGEPSAAAPYPGFTPWPTATPGVVPPRTTPVDPVSEARSIPYYVVD